MYYYQQNPFLNNGFNQPNPQLNSQGGLKGRPVSSLEEVRAAQVDFDGSLFVFPDIANKRIYTKQINLDGTASLNMYELTSIPQSNAPNNNYVTREEFQNAINKIQETFNNYSTNNTKQQYAFKEEGK